MSGVFRNYWTPTPSPPSACFLPPRTKGDTLAGRWGDGGSIFRKTPDIGMASYSIIPLRIRGRRGWGISKARMAWNQPAREFSKERSDIWRGKQDIFNTCDQLHITSFKGTGSRVPIFKQKGFVLGKNKNSFTVVLEFQNASLIGISHAVKKKPYWRNNIYFVEVLYLLNFNAKGYMRPVEKK